MSALFNGISNKEKQKLFTLLHTHVYTFDPNVNIIPTIRNTNIIGIVDDGTIEFTKTNYYGDTTLIEVLQKDDIFGTSISSLYNNEVELTTTEKTTVLIIDFKSLMREENISKPYYNIFIQNLFTILNDKIKTKNDRISILTNKTIRNRLLEYFNTNKDIGTRTVTLPFTYTDLAAYLGVDRSAMTREIKYLKEERLIEIKGKRITILY